MLGSLALTQVLAPVAALTGFAAIYAESQGNETETDSPQRKEYKNANQQFTNSEISAKEFSEVAKKYLEHLQAHQRTKLLPTDLTLFIGGMAVGVFLDYTFSSFVNPENDFSTYYSNCALLNLITSASWNLSEKIGLLPAVLHLFGAQEKSFKKES